MIDGALPSTFTAKLLGPVHPDFASGLYLNSPGFLLLISPDGGVRGVPPSLCLSI